MGDGLRRVQLTDPEWGELKLLVAIPKDGDPWGVLAPLRDTAWGRQIQVVSSDALSHALHGWATPLMREIGVAPKVHASRIGDDVGRCGLDGSCLGARAECRPGTATPDCYEAPKLRPSVSLMAATVALAWRDGFYVVVADGDGFVAV